MPDKPVMHGADHRPGGLDPSPTGPWHYVLESGAADWNSGTNYTAGQNVSHDVFQYLCLIPNTNTEPNVDTQWARYWTIDAPLFQNGFINSGGSYTHMRYKLAVGAPNFLDKDNGSIVSYAQHQVIVQGSVSSGAVGTTIFSLPPAYAPDSDLHLTACDDDGVLVVITVQQAGDVIDGFV